MEIHPLDLENPTPADSRMDTLYAWIAIHENGGEGILAGGIPGLGMVSLICGNERLAEKLERLADAACAASARAGKPVTKRLAIYKRVS
jgi:hypothetical protein